MHIEILFQKILQIQKKIHKKKYLKILFKSEHFSNISLSVIMNNLEYFF